MKNFLVNPTVDFFTKCVLPGILTSNRFDKAKSNKIYPEGNVPFTYIFNNE